MSDLERENTKLRQRIKELESDNAYLRFRYEHWFEEAMRARGQNLYWQRFLFLVDKHGCPFAETDDAWTSAEVFVDRLTRAHE